MFRDLLPDNHIQMGLFDDINRKRSKKLMKTLDSVNLKMGSGTLTYAATGLAGAKSWHTAFKNRSPFYTTDWNQIPEVL